MSYTEFFISFALAFIIAFTATPIAKKIAIKLGAVDIPKDNRRMHKKPIARLGGLAIVAGFVVAIFFELIISNFNISEMFNPDEQFFWLLVGDALIVAIGIIDDIKQLGAKIKLLVQIVAALVVVIPGTRISVMTNPFAASGITELNVYLSIVLSIVWIIGITNAFNLIDGLDGLSAGVSSIASLSLFFVSLIIGDSNSALITLILAGSTMGFLPYNFNPAKIFMGDTGSTFLGFTLGVVSIQGLLKSYAAIAIAVPLLVLGLPLFDTSFAILRRLFTGKPIMQADRGHLHHRLIDMGLSHKQSVVAMYIASAALGLCAIVLADKGVISAIFLVVAVSVFVIGGAKYMTEMSDKVDDNSQDEEDGNIILNDIEERKENS